MNLTASKSSLPGLLHKHCVSVPCSPHDNNNKDGYTTAEPTRLEKGSTDTKEQIGTAIIQTGKNETLFEQGNIRDT